MVANTSNVNAQKNTGLTAMTLTSTESINKSSASSSVPDDLISQPIQNKTVNYYDNTYGYLVYPVISQNESVKKLPAVVMIHENKD